MPSFISSFSPNPIILGSTVTINGTGFTSNMPGDIFTAYLGTSGNLTLYPASTTHIASDTVAQVVFPVTIPAGTYRLSLITQSRQISDTAANDAIVPAAQNFVVTADSNNISTAQSTNLHATLNGTDVTSSTTFSGPGVSGMTFTNPTPGTYTVFGDYNSLTSSTGITVYNAFIQPPAENLIGYSVVALYSPQIQTPFCKITVSSQINVFFGDGRHGYIPAGTIVYLQPGQCWYGTYQETLNDYLIPIVDATPSKQMTSLTTFMQTTSDPMEIYNIGTIVSNGQNGYTRPYSVVFGICDPTEGLFQSMWDFITVSYPIDNDIPPQPPCGHGMMISENSSKTVENYVKEKNIQGMDIDLSSLQVFSMWTGEVSFKDGELQVLKPISLMKLNKQNQYIKAFEFSEKSIKIQDNQFLIFENSKIFVISENDILPNSSGTFILGIVQNGKFYSTVKSIVVKKS